MISNGLLSLQVDVARRELTLAHAATGQIILGQAWMSADEWGRDWERRRPVDEWVANVAREEVEDAIGRGERLAVELTCPQRPALPTYLFRYTLYARCGTLFMGFGMHNRTAIDLRLMSSEPLLGAKLFPDQTMEQVLTLNGAAGAQRALVESDGDRASPNSLMLTGLVNGVRRTIVWGGLGNKEFGKYAAIKDHKLKLSAQDPVGRLVDAGQRYWSEDTFYLDALTDDPFAALEAYGRAMRQANQAQPKVYDFPVLCGWGVGALSKLPDVNNSRKLVDELEAAQKAGVTRYTKVGIRLEPDTYCNKTGDTEQGWWDDAHWAQFGHLVPPYETFAKWCAAIKAREGIPYTYFQVGMPSDDYARAFPGHMLFNDISRLQVRHAHHQPLVSYDYTDPDFQKHMLEVWKRLRKDGMCGIKFDYPETGWRPEGGFEDRHATAAFAYREVFRLCREGLGPDAFLDERNLGESGRPCLDVTAGLVDTQRNWTDSNQYEPAMITIGGLRWYKNRTVFDYYPDSKTVHDCSRAIRQSMLTMVFLTSGRIDLATSFTLFTPEIVHDFTRIYPAYREPFTARPLDAFTGVRDPQVYDLELTPDWHQVALYNTGAASGTVSVALAGERVGNAIGLDASAYYYAYDFWSDAFLGRLPGTARIERLLEPNGCAMISVRRAVDHPQVLSTNRHVLQGWVELAEVRWDATGQRLTGVAQVVGGEPFRIVVAGNGRKAVLAGAGPAEARLDAHPSEGLSVLVLERPETGAVTWQIQFT